MRTSLFSRMQNGILALGLMTLLFACNKEEITEIEEVNSLEKMELTLRSGKSFGSLRIAGGLNACGTPRTVRLMAGQNIPVGEVTAYNDEDNLYITVSIEGAYAKDWFIRKSHLYVGERDQTEGIKNPAPGKFPYQNDVVSDNNTGVQEHTYVIPAEPLKTWGEFDIALHVDVVRVALDGDNIAFDSNGMATVVQREGAWGEGTRFTMKGNWAMFFTYTLQDCEVLCNDTWFRVVTKDGNGSPETEEIVFDLLDGNKKVGKVVYKRTGNSTSGKIEAVFSIYEDLKEDYYFEEFSAIYRTTSLPESGLTREDFVSNMKFDSEGGKIEFSNIVGSLYYLGLYTKITGKCN
jgi:hypothetical protein